MPLYEYECDHCGHVFEKIQSMHDLPIQLCPNCGTSPVRKLFHPAGIIFKGSGWYINDSRKNFSDSPSAKSGESKTVTTSESKPASETKPSTETKSESKPEAKPSAEAKQKPDQS